MHLGQFPNLRTAVKILQYFNALEGITLYPRVRDTEHRLQADQIDHILHGVVDLLVDSIDKNSKKAVLYFLNELNGATCPSQRPVNALIQVSIEPDEIEIAINEVF